jgi:hypothetical protein
MDHSLGDLGIALDTGRGWGKMETRRIGSIKKSSHSFFVPPGPIFSR